MSNAKGRRKRPAKAKSVKKRTKPVPANATRAKGKAASSKSRKNQKSSKSAKAAKSANGPSNGATDALLRAAYTYGAQLATNMAGDVEADDDAISEAWDEIGDSSMLYDEIIEEELEGAVPGSNPSWSKLSHVLGPELRRGFRETIKARA